MRQWYKTFAFSWVFPGSVVAYAAVWALLAVDVLLGATTFAECYPEFRGCFVVIIGASALAFGAARAIIPNPCRPGYFAWLYLSPWTARQPLPLGPLHLVWQDFALLGFLTTLMHVHKPGMGPVVPLIALTAYGLVLASTVLLADGACFGYLFGFAFAPLLFLVQHPVFFGIDCALAYLILLLGLKRSLSRFPWNLSPDRSKDRNSVLDPLAIQGSLRSPLSVLFQATQKGGWPLGSMAPEGLPKGISYGKALAVSCLAAWWYMWVLAWAFAGISVTPDEAQTVALVMNVPSAYVLFFCAISRLTIYVVGHASPISLFGRLCTGRPVIWGHDKVFAAPICSLAIALPLPVLLVRMGVPAVPAAAIGFAAGLAILLCMGPTLSNWRLTGAYRSYPRVLDVGKLKDLTRI